MTYSLLQRSIAAKGSTPLWILWLVMMAPALIWSTWTLVKGTDQPMPLALVLIPFLASPIVYWVLLRQSLRSVQRQENRALEQVADTPITDLPSISAPPKPLDPDEEADLNHCFPWSHFALHKVEYRLQAVICQGQLRSDPSVAYQRIQQNVKARFGDRFLVLLQENFQGQPFFALVPNPQRVTSASSLTPTPSEGPSLTADSPAAPSQGPAVPNTDSDDDRLYRPGLALGLLLMTLVTTTFVGLIFAGVTPEEMGTVSENPVLLLEGLPYSLAIMAVLGCHEMGHFLAARHYQVRTTLPYFIPVPFFLGTFGAFIQMRSPVPNRKALFDVSIAGPLAGLVVTLPCLWWGLHQSLVTERAELSSLLNFESLDPWRSLLLACLSRLALGDSLAPDSALQLHPVAVAGYLGLIVTALNLMPVGQLDGGHIIHAMFGQRTGAIVGQVTRFLMLMLSLVQPDLLLWALLLLFMPVVDEPALNDVSELDDTRDLLGFAVLVLLLLIIMPVPASIVALLT